MRYPECSGIGVMLLEPVVDVEEVELLGPQHAGQRLAHHVGRIATHRRRRDRLVELIGLAQPAGEEVVEVRAERLGLADSAALGEAAGG